MWNSTYLTQPYRKTPSPGLRGLATLVMMLAMASASAGTLRLGTPTINNNQYTFPVVLQGDAEGVAALDFRLAYDPAVFNPVSAQSGTTALQAQKQVSSNVAAPGEFVVVLMGFNQNTVGAGEVVEVVLEKIGEPSGGATTLRIAEPTLATNVGIEVDSRGVGRTLRFPTDNDETSDDVAEDESEPTETADESPASMNDEGSPDGTYPSGPIFVARAEQGLPSDRENTGSAVSQSNGTTGGPATAGTTTPSPSATSGANGAEIPSDSHTPALAATSQSEKVTRARRADSPENTVHSPIDTEISAAEPLDSEALKVDKQEKQELNEEKGRHGVPKYATLLLLAVSIPVGLLAILRIAGK